jgi:hypothetical protein
MTSPKPTEDGLVKRAARLKWLPLADLHPSPIAQRNKLNQARVDHIAANLDLEQIGTPTINERGGRTYIIDGWHRVEALRQFGFADTDKIQCWTYVDLTEEEEAERFLKLNDTLAVDALSKFRVSVNAGRLIESDVDRIVRAHNLTITGDKIEGGIRAVGTIVKIYKRAGAEVLARTLRISRDAYGTPGLEAAVLDGIGLLCGRYNGELEDQVAVAKLSKIHGGVNGLLGKAAQLRLSTGQPRAHCVAAAAVDIINSGQRGGKRLTSWWKKDAA